LVTMKFTIKNNGELNKDYSCVFTTSDIEALLESEAQKLQSSVAIDGFRKGHVPLDIIKKRYIERCISRGVVNAIQENIDKTVKENNYRLLSRPQIKDEAVDYTQVGNIELEVSILLAPNVPQIDYKKIKIERPTLNLTEEEITKELNSVAGSFASVQLIEDSETIAAIGHVLDIDFEGFIDEKKFDGGTATNQLLELGSKTFIDTFEQQLVGKKAGDNVDVTVKFPQEYHQKDLADKKAVFKVKVNKLFNKITPPVDDELAKKVGFNALTDFKAAILEQMSGTYAGSVNEIIKTKV
jgi:trigger factor